MVTVEVLKGFELFKGLAEDNLATIAELCHPYAMHEGDRIFAEATKARDVHLCSSGKVDILILVGQPWNKNIAVHRAVPGEVFGWSALVEPYIYTASAKCLGKVEEIYIKGSDLMKLFEQSPHVGYVVMRNLSASVSSRLTETREKLTKAIAAASNKDW